MKTSMIVAKSRDVQEVVSKLSSDKAKTREEGIKLLSTWLEGEGSFSFCKLIGRKTAILNQGDIPHSETWPFLVKLLITCIKLEISTSKKRPPKLLLAKMLRTIVQHAEDIRFSGKRLLLLSVVKLLFNHILDVVKDSTVYQSEYNVILRHLLSVKEYCCQMRKRIYCSLVLIYMKNVELAMDKKGQFLFNGKEDVFRNVLTLHVLLENSPGDFPDNLRGDVVKGFIGIFSNMREEGKVSRNLMECINTYLLKDGPNIGSQAMDIHRSLQDFVFHCWLTTHDKGLKNCLINYAKLQLRLNRISEDGIIIEQLLLVFDKELNQNIIGTIGIPKCDTVKDDKACILGSLHMGLMELAASVYYQVNKLL
ncbi:hypothetical protein ZOSMA_4G00230 [Zostera marina]|uniref:Serine/threonine-protein kinase ATM n=1 Tax=Zostera marina TaxID=29655 RepID=A0A0K9NYB7_ZOSMR|nr:hypothetical protein ZOSMA_4G00230 [Zostera marina]